MLKALDQPAETQIAIPDNATVSLYDELNSEWSVMGSVQWTNWSLIKTLTVQAGNSLEATPINFRDTWMGSIGANYRPPVFPRLTLQFGLLYDTGANTDATRGARLPDEDRIGVGTGVSFAVTPRMNVRLAYLHEFPGFGGDKINYSNNFPNAGTIVGAYADNADVASAGVTLKF